MKEEGNSEQNNIPLADEYATTLNDSDVCEECGGSGVIKHPCMPGYYGDCPVCGVP